jgi:hypothetical protein
MTRTAVCRLLGMEYPRTDMDWCVRPGGGCIAGVTGHYAVCDPIMDAYTGNVCVLRRFVLFWQLSADGRTAHLTLRTLCDTFPTLSQDNAL